VKYPAVERESFSFHAVRLVISGNAVYEPPGCELHVLRKMPL
jgi:hypothetical protein